MTIDAIRDTVAGDDANAGSSTPAQVAGTLQLLHDAEWQSSSLQLHFADEADPKQQAVGLREELRKLHRALTVRKPTDEVRDQADEVEDRLDKFVTAAAKVVMR